MHAFAPRSGALRASGGAGEIAAAAQNPIPTPKVPERSARSEMEMSRSVIEASLGMRPDHLSYPVGDKTSAAEREFRIAAELGFKTAVTTRPGVLFPEHRDHLMSLPRISLNGEHQQLRYVRVLLSGAATAVFNDAHVALEVVKVDGFAPVRSSAPLLADGSAAKNDRSKSSRKSMMETGTTGAVVSSGSGQRRQRRGRAVVIEYPGERRLSRHHQDTDVPGRVRRC